MKFRFIFYILILVVCVAPAHALINGEKLEGYADLVRLDFTNGNICTGFFVDRYTIVTAAHCIANDEKLEKIVTEKDEVVSVEIIKNIAHPDYHHSWWPSNDVGIIKTSEYKNFQNNFNLELKTIPLKGAGIIFGCGTVQLEPKLRERSKGKNTFLRLSSVFFFLGKSKGSSISLNDSGGPVLDESTGKVIAISTQSSVVSSIKYGIPILSLATSIVENSNSQFILNHMGVSK